MDNITELEEAANQKQAAYDSPKDPGIVIIKLCVSGFLTVHRLQEVAHCGGRFLVIAFAAKLVQNEVALGG